MTDDELRKWADTQVKALIACGIDALDAENTVGRVLDKLPPGQDPDRWLPSAPGGSLEISDEEIADARADWYVDAEPKFARLLDAVEVNE